MSIKKQNTVLKEKRWGFLLHFVCVFVCDVFTHMYVSQKTTCRC